MNVEGALGQRLGAKPEGGTQASTGFNMEKQVTSGFQASVPEDNKGNKQIKKMIFEWHVRTCSMFIISY